MEPRKHLYIDGLRGIAILLVLLVHNRFLVAGAEYFSPNVLEVVESGQYGVQLFFVVSAYTLMASFYSRSGEPSQTRNFFIRRFFRIAPMYYLAIVYFTFQNFVGFETIANGSMLAKIPGGRLFSNIFFLNGFNPYWINNYVPGGWSIAIEMTFYLLLPLLCRVIKNANAALVLFAVSTLFATLLEQLLHHTFLHNNEYLFYYFPNQLPVFSLGIFAYFVVRDGLPTLPLRTVALLGFMVLVYSFAAFSKHISLSIGYAIFLILLANKPHKLVANRILTETGKVSFSMYLVHFAIMHWMFVWHWQQLFTVNDAASAVLNFVCSFALLFILSFAISTLLYRCVELPFQQFGKRLINWFQRQQRFGFKTRLASSQKLPD
ncbi:MAG TPA: acyltransferase [Flavisolibacter sp.]|nr:acyltransferase [Flavisolibacter sp.]